MKTSNLLCGAIAAALSVAVVNSNADEPGSVAENAPGKINAAAPRLSYGVKEVLKMQENGIDKNVIRSYIENSNVSSQPTSEEIIYLHQRGLPDDLTTALIQHSGQVRAQTPVAAPDQQAVGNNSVTVAPPVQVAQQPTVVAQSPVYVYPQYVDSYPVYSPSLSFGYYGYWGGAYWPYYRAGFYGRPFVNHGFNHFGHGFVGGGHFNGGGHFGGGGGHFGGGGHMGGGHGGGGHH